MRPSIVLIAAVTTALAAVTPSLEQANKLYNRTEYQASLKLLQAGAEKDAATYDLIGRNYYMLGDFKKASEAYEKAVSLEPNNSNYEHWLGKAYGRRAETSSPLTAPGYASKTRQHFEKAVALNPRNLEAANDLFEYYLQAPGFLGGGLDKASDLAKRIAAMDPIEGHWANARIAEKRKQFGQAEEQLRRAAELAPKQVGRIVDLAKFFAKQGRYQESDQKFREAEKIAPGDPKILYERAATYIKTNRNLDQARELLKQYLHAQLSPEDPPRSDAEKLLKQTGS
jgi:tetratricopeptide (TPR) repeat protein